MSSIPCDIVMIPDTNIADAVTALSQQFSVSDTYFTLQEGSYFPHASLYMVQIDTDRLEEISAKLIDIANNASKISLEPKEYHQEWGYLDIEYHRELASDLLQMQVVNAINPLRDGLRDKDKERLKTATGKELENIEKYGYRSIGELFAPHITITRFTNREDIDLTLLPNVHNFPATFSKIGIFEMGDNGTCVRKIAEFPLT